MRHRWGPDLLSLSEPARSTRLSLPLVTTPVTLFSLMTVTVSIIWDREECSFMFVIAVDACMKRCECYEKNVG